MLIGFIEDEQWERLKKLFDGSDGSEDFIIKVEYLGEASKQVLHYEGWAGVSHGDDGPRIYFDSYAGHGHLYIGMCKVRPFVAILWPCDSKVVGIRTEDCDGCRLIAIVVRKRDETLAELAMMRLRDYPWPGEKQVGNSQ